MKFKAPLTAAVLSLAVLTACGDRADNNNDVGDAASTPATDASATAGTGATGAADPMTPGMDAGMGTGAGDAATAGGAMTEGDVLGMVTVVNEHEIASSKAAQEKGVKGKTLDFAKMMITDHTKNQDQVRALEGSAGVTIGTGGEVATHRAKHEAERTQMAAMNGDAFERAYIDGQVRGHQETLTMLDSRLIPAAQNAAVKQHLTATRAAVAAHLEQARALQGQGGGAGAAAGTGATGTGTTGTATDTQGGQNRPTQ